MDIFGIVSIPNWLLILLVVLVTYYLYMTRKTDVFRKMGVPVAGGKGVPILGHIANYQKHGLHICDREWMQKYGKVYGTFYGSDPELVVSDTEMLKKILVKEFNNFPDRKTFEGLGGELEYGIADLKGEHWKHVRSILTPTFSAGKLKNMMPHMLRASSCLVDNLRLKLKKSKQQDMKRVFGGYTMDVISSTAFGIEVDSQTNPDDPLVKNASDLFKFSMANLANIVIMFFPFTLRFFAKFGISYFPRSCGRFFKQFVLKLMSERQLDKKEYRDFFQLMLDVKREDGDNKWDPNVKSLSTDEIIGQAILFFVAGYETTGTTLSLIAYNLALNPDKQQKLYEEVIEKLGSDRPSYDNVNDLVYVEMCINETLRLFPPAMRFDRVCLNDIEIDGLKIPKDMTVSVPVYGIHHSPEFWDGPEEFKPERFCPEEKARMNPLHYLPFGYGPRNCIGMRLAFLEMKVALADFVRNFHVSVCEKTNFPHLFPCCKTCLVVASGEFMYEVPPNFQKMDLLIPADVWLKIEERN